MEQHLSVTSKAASNGYFLDLFAGKGPVAAALRRLKQVVLEVDVANGAEFDLTDDAVLACIIDTIGSGSVRGVWSAIVQ